MNRKIKIATDTVVKYRIAPIDDALLQTIYNSIDADAVEVSITALTCNGETLKFDDDNETLAGIRVEDNGVGILFNKLEEYSQQLERSRKDESMPNGRVAYYGAKGFGRFKVLVIGDIGKYFSALANESNLACRPNVCQVFCSNNKLYKVVGIENELSVLEGQVVSVEFRLVRGNGVGFIDDATDYYFPQIINASRS